MNAPVALSGGRTRLVATTYATALLQGVALVSFPAAGNLLRDPRQHALSASEYGGLFLPMFAVAALSSLAAGGAAHRFGLANLYRAGVIANGLGMALFAASALFVGNHERAYAVLLLAIGCEGLGFGTTVTALNGHVQRLFPGRSARALTALHALLGVGTALPPLLLPWALAFGGFWLLPAAVAAAFGAALSAFGAGERWLPVSAERMGARTARRSALLPAASVAALYGFAEAIVGNWGTLFLHEERGASLSAAGTALAVFWASLTLGRLLLGAFGAWIAPERVFLWLPFVLGAGLLLAARGEGPLLAIVAFACAGLGGSSLLPLSFELGARGAKDSERSSGLVFALFLSGSALGSFGVGLLHEHGLSLVRVFELAPVLALALVFVTRWAVWSVTRDGVSRAKSEETESGPRRSAGDPA